MWTRICNLQMECNIPSLYSRIMALNVYIIAKALSHMRKAKPPYAKHIVGTATRTCNMCKEYIERKPNCMFDLYRVRAPH